MHSVSLREITADTVLDICRLSDGLSDQHKAMVAPNAISLAQALFTEGAWYRAVYVDDTPVGFLMTHTETENGVTEVFLWRLMIASPHQGKGYGKQALTLLIEDLKAQGHKEFVTSCGQGEGSPKGFYESLGFVANGDMLDDEIVLVLSLGGDQPPIAGGINVNPGTGDR